MDCIDELETERECVDPYQRRRRRKETLLGKLYDYCQKCYSEVDVVIAEYPIRKHSNPKELQVPCQYILARFPVAGGPQPQLDWRGLSRIRSDRKATLEDMLRRYHRDCNSDIYVSISEHVAGQSNKRRWQPSIQIFKRRLVKNTSKCFPPSEEELKKHYPPPIHITSENFSKSVKASKQGGSPIPSTFLAVPHSINLFVTGPSPSKVGSRKKMIGRKDRRGRDKLVAQAG